MSKIELNKKIWDLYDELPKEILDMDRTMIIECEGKIYPHYAWDRYTGYIKFSFDKTYDGFDGYVYDQDEDCFTGDYEKLFEFEGEDGWENKVNLKIHKLEFDLWKMFYKEYWRITNLMNEEYEILKAGK